MVNIVLIIIFFLFFRHIFSILVQENLIGKQKLKNQFFKIVKLKTHLEISKIVNISKSQKSLHYIYIVVNKPIF